MTTPDTTARVPAAGTMWQLRSLIAMGHDATRIAAALGTTPATARRLIGGRTATITPALRNLACQLQDAWWDKRPPENTPARRAAATTARRTAQRNGWPQPAALDEDRLDQPGYRPYSIWRPAAGTGTAPAFQAQPATRPATAPGPAQPPPAAAPPRPVPPATRGPDDPQPQPGTRPA
jgi:hypothetical protein